MAKRILLFILAWFAAISHAEQVATRDDSLGIPPLFSSVAAHMNIPAPIFYAVILQESKRRVAGPRGEETLAWPWTINHRGKAFFFSGRKQAVAYARDILANGDEHFDVGYGQINWFYHKDRFDSLEEAFDPIANLVQAATILQEQKSRPECATWALAIGCYHRPGRRSKDLKIAHKYALSVVGIWLSLYE